MRRCLLWPRRVRVFAGLLTAFIATAACAQSAPELVRAADTVVAFSNEGGPGAGIVVGRGPDSLLVLTAAHVLGADGSEARHLSAKLKSAPGRELTDIKVLRVDRSLDLAALRIEGLRGAGVEACKQPIAGLNADLPVRREHAVFPIGNPAGVAWAIPPSPDHVSDVSLRELRFQSSTIDIGHSGGGLFNVFGDLVGMIRADQPPWGVALRVAVLSKAVADWRLGGDPATCTSTTSTARAAPPTTAFQRWAATAASSREAFITAAGYATPSPASLAVFANDVASLERLAAAGAKLDDDRGVTPLQWAVALGRHDMVRYLILKGVPLNTYGRLTIPGVAFGDSEEVVSALHMAARMDDAEAVKLLVKAGADVSQGYNVERHGSPLTIAVRHGSARAAKALLAAGADPTEERGGWSDSFPLLAALERGDLEMLKLLRASGARLSIRIGNTVPSTIMSLAAEKSPLESIRWLIAQKVPVNCNEPTCGDSPLYVAVRANRVDVIETLIKAGANPTGNSFEPYLCLAVMMDNKEALKALLLAGANPNQAGRDGTPLAMARRDEKKEMVDALLAHGAKR